MGFIDAYKHLEKLCGDTLNDDRRISAYIDAMLRLPQGSYIVAGWDEDLKQLKHYRWVRNQIAHEPGCNEDNMCDDEDVQWIEQFYVRVMQQTDPLALYRKQMQYMLKSKTKKQKSEIVCVQKPKAKKKDSSASVIAALFLMSAALLTLLGVAFYLLLQ